MTLDKNWLVAFILLMLIMSSRKVEADESWPEWESLRWTGLQQFSQGNIRAARNAFERALAEAKRIKPESKIELVSVYDLAQVCDDEGKIQQAESYCNEALKLGKKVCPHDPVIVLILSSLVDLKRGEG